eukprot:TRINITY_DN2898_c4_g1_i2.p1 TRINITY_DN2898_c4_g1~~TRINITY_DN2898_c4_g1_i2.p1  ORF type:complete len:176 (+),score=40.31 TRINITY_DN2898_c4_g1_i2:226-753(+)
MYASVAAVFAFLAVSAQAKEEHDNWIYFDGNSSLTVNFSLDHHSITKGQPYSGVSVSGNGIKVRAGRHESEECAAAFVDGVTALNVLATKHMIDALPHKLNFAIFGNLTLTGSNNNTVECRNFRIAQGHYDTTNNWWMGAEYCVTAPTTQKMTCECSQKVEFHGLDKSDKMYALF